MRIAVISARELVGGAALAATRLCKGMAGQGHTVQRYVARVDDPHTTAVDFNQPGRCRSALIDVVKWLRLERNQCMAEWRGRAGLRNLCTKVGHFAPDVIHVHNFNQWVWPPVERAGFLKLCGIAPVVWTLHDMWPLNGCCDYVTECPHRGTAAGELDVLRRCAVSEANRHRDRAAFQSCAKRLVFVAPSRWLARLGHDYFEGQIRSETIANGLDLSEFKPLLKGTARETLGLPSNRKIVLAVAEHLHAARKGMKILGDAMARLGSSALLVTIGNTAGQPGWPADARHMGYVDDTRMLRIVYAAADVLVVPSLMDNLPNVILEAMACGTPTVAARAGGVPDAVRPGVTGELAEPGNAIDLAAKIQSMLALDRGQADALGRSCRAVAESDYDVMKQAGAYVELFSRLKGAGS